MRIRTGLVIAFLAVTTGFASPSFAKDIQVASGHLTKEQVIDRVFTTVERRILRRYYEARHGEAADNDDSHGKRGHKGKGKKHKGMPPGLAKRLPSDLRRELPPRSPQYRRVIVDNDIVLIDAATNKVLDILEDVILGGR